MKKVAILLPSLQVGGAERLVYEEVSFLRHDPRFYFEIHVVFGPGPMYSKFLELGIPVHVWNAQHKSLQTILTCLKIVFYLRRNQFDILHSHLLYIIGPWMGLFAGTKVITTDHSNTRYSFMKRLSLRRSDILFGCSEQVLKGLIDIIPEKKLKLLYNAIRPITSNCIQSKNILNRLSLCNDDKIVLTLGRLTRQKGYDVLVEAFKIVAGKEPNAVLLIGGDGPDREILEQQIMTLKLQKHVRLLGIVNDVNELFEICDIYVNSSRFEGLPMTILEAMAHKKPIVSTRIGGNSEVVIHGKTGMLVEPERSDLLAEAILTLLGDIGLQRKLGGAAFELFENNYTIEKHCKALASFYLA